MSKLAMVRQYRYSPAAGGLFSFLKPLTTIVGGAIKGIAGLSSKTAQVQTIAAPAVIKAKAPSVSPLLAGYGGGGGGTRRRKGITHGELRGYRKVANLIHKEGMVSKRTRGRKV
jgi:hypothetical protein